MYKKTLFVVVTIFFAGCASNPKEISAAYVSPLKYEDFSCKQLAVEIDHVEHRTNTLYQSLKKKHSGDSWQMGLGMVLFWPALFFLEGGDGPEASEYAQLKGEYEALRTNTVKKECGFDTKSPEEIIKNLQDEKSKKDKS